MVYGSLLRVILSPFYSSPTPVTQLLTIIARFPLNNADFPNRRGKLSTVEQTAVFDSMAGRVVAWIAVSWDVVQQVADVRALAVVLPYQRKGIAARLLGHIAVHPVIMVFDRILFVDVVNTAGRSFYDAQGWMLVQRPLPASYDVYNPTEEPLPASYDVYNPTEEPLPASSVYECRRFGG